VAHTRSDVAVFGASIAWLWAEAKWEILMRKIMLALATIALLAEPIVAMPVNPAPIAPVVSDGQIVSIAHVHRAVRRTARRVDRRH